MGAGAGAQDAAVPQELWGAATWRAMHCVALGFPGDADEFQRATYRHFFVALGQVLPCPVCAESYRRLLRSPARDAALDAALAAPSNMSTTSTSKDRSTVLNPLFEWTVDMHNAVNAELGRPASWTPRLALDAILQSASASASASVSSSSSSSSSQLDRQLVDPLQGPQPLARLAPAMTVAFVFALLLLWIAKTVVATAFRFCKRQF
jgi:hypothetical protein